MMKKIIFASLLLSTSAFAVNFGTSTASDIALENKSFQLKTEKTNISLNFVTHNELVLKTTCYDAKGSYVINKLADSKYQIEFGLQDYENVVNNCQINSYDKAVTTTALHSLVDNTSLTFFTDHYMNLKATMIDSKGSMISYQVSNL